MRGAALCRLVRPCAVRAALLGMTGCIPRGVPARGRRGKQKPVTRRAGRCQGVPLSADRENETTESGFSGGAGTRRCDEAQGRGRERGRAVIKDGARMLNLEPLVTRLVEDVLRAVRGTTLAELRGLTAPSNRASTRKSSAARHAGPSRRVKRRLPRKIATDSQSRSVSDRADAVSVGAIVRLPTGANITDPERLLETTPLIRTQQAPAPCEGGAADDPEEEPPSSTVRPVVGSVVSLRPGESLVSASGAGIVIRRAKKA